jgi:hypothetical protein
VNNKTAVANLWSRIYSIDWKLLIFLLLFLDVKIWMKIAAIVLIYILRFDFKFGFRLKAARLPLFYILVIVIAIFNWLISGNIGNLNYDLVLLSGILFWVLCILAIHQLKLSVEKNDVETIHRTILVFFLLNAVVSLAVYAGIILETGHINPYRYQGNYQKYFIGTGDYIKGITLDTSTTNAVLNAFGIIYYLVRKKYVMVLLCMVVLLMTGSNVTNLLLVLTLIYMFIFGTTKDQKSMVIVCLLMLVIFLAKISPQNNKYIKTLFTRLSKDIPKEKPVYLNTTSITELPDSILSADDKKKKVAQLYLDSVQSIATPQNVSTKPKGPVNPNIPPVREHIVKLIEKPVIPKDSIHTPTFQHRNDTTVIEKNMLKFIDSQRLEVPIAANRKQSIHIPGKLVALKQTLEYFDRHPWLSLTGTGIGNFSSKLAFRVTGMKVAGSYPEKYVYINEDFKVNHLDLYLFYFTSGADLHSIANSPNSAYDQLWGEYGLAGLLAFAFFYALYFKRKIKKGSYALPLLIFMLGIFFIEYWFEQLSVVVFFELLILLNIKETSIIDNYAAK